MEEKEMHANSVSHDGLTSEKEIESLHNELAALRDANQKLEADVAEERRLFKMIREERDLSPFDGESASRGVDSVCRNLPSRCSLHAR